MLQYDTSVSLSFEVVSVILPVESGTCEKAAILREDFSIVTPNFSK